MSLSFISITYFCVSHRDKKSIKSLVGKFEASKKELKKLKFEQKSGISPALSEACLIVEAKYRKRFGKINWHFYV